MQTVGVKMMTVQALYWLSAGAGAFIGGAVVGFVAFVAGAKYGIDKTFEKLEAEGKILNTAEIRRLGGERAGK
jgi:hypothetical protein